MGSVEHGHLRRRIRLASPGELWIGDTSAFPTCSGGSTTVTCMALARRTAGFLNQAVNDPSRSKRTTTAVTPTPTAPAASPQPATSVPAPAR